MEEAEEEAAMEKTPLQALSWGCFWTAHDVAVNLTFLQLSTWRLF